MATIIFGNIAALTQHNVKRLIGLSGVSHAGFLLIGVIAATDSPLAVGAIYFYLYSYLIASFAVFGVMAHVAGSDDADQELDHYAGLWKENPFLATVLAIGLGSLAGIPPLVGFMGKLLVFMAAFRAELYGLLGIAIVLCGLAHDPAGDERVDAGPAAEVEHGLALGDLGELRRHAAAEAEVGVGHVALDGGVVVADELDVGRGVGAAAAGGAAAAVGRGARGPDAGVLSGLECHPVCLLPAHGPE